MAQVPPIDDAYIDDIIKSAGAYDPALNITQGVKLRELFKLMRDRLEQGIAQDQFNPIAGTNILITGTAPNYTFSANQGRGANQLVTHNENGDTILGRVAILGSAAAAGDDLNIGSAVQLTDGFEANTIGKAARMQLGNGGDILFKTFTGPGDGTGGWYDRLRISNSSGKITLSAAPSQTSESSPQILTRNITTGDIEYTLSSPGAVTSQYRQLTYFSGAIANIAATDVTFFSYSLPVNTLKTNGDKLKFEMSGMSANTDNYKYLSFGFGSSRYGLYPHTTSGGIWYIQGTILRVTPTSYALSIQKTVWGNQGMDGYSDIGILGTGINVLSLVASSENVASNDLVLKFVTVDYIPAPI